MTIYDGMVGPWFLPTFLDDSGLESVHCAVLMSSIEVCVVRVMDREEHGFREGRNPQPHRQAVGWLP
jgi:hypothetical protein